MPSRRFAMPSPAADAWCRSAFYEWQKVDDGKTKQPYAIALADRSLMALAGLWENWKSPAGEWIRSFRIATTPPNDLCTQLHNRMPVILAPASWPLWLAPIIHPAP
jgi:putative SOS response-associated peptidase YedK